MNEYLKTIRLVNNAAPIQSAKPEATANVYNVPRFFLLL